MLILMALNLLTLVDQLRVTNVEEWLENSQDRKIFVQLRCILDGNIGFPV